MKILFTLWLMIQAGWMSNTVWPTDIVGPMPVCANIDLNDAAGVTCDGAPAQDVFKAWWKGRGSGTGTTKQISNGF